MTTTNTSEEIIDVEVIERHDYEPESTGVALARVEIPASEPGPGPGTGLPPLFTLPAELEPERIIATQRQRLQEMIDQIEGRVEVPPAPAPELESPEEFINRAMAQLDEHMLALDRALERIVGARFAPSSQKTSTK